LHILTGNEAIKYARNFYLVDKNRYNYNSAFVFTKINHCIFFQLEFEFCVQITFVFTQIISNLKSYKGNIIYHFLLSNASYLFKLLVFNDFYNFVTGSKIILLLSPFLR